MIRGLTLKRPPRPSKQFSPTATGFGESTYAELAWQRSRVAARRWAIWGAVLGALAALVVYAPASWVAGPLARATGQRLLLADARGTVWNGSAVLVLTAGPDSRDASALPGRLSWTLRPRGFGLQLALEQACCIQAPLRVRLEPGWGRVRIVVAPSESGAPIGHWPAALLSGLGTPFNTMQLGGRLQLATPGLTADWVQGRWLLDGEMQLGLLQVSSRLSTLEPLGSYLFTLAGDPESPGTSLLTLSTSEGALQLSGEGSWSAAGVRFRGEASAKPSDEAALNNLLNIIGRRSGARSVISIG